MRKKKEKTEISGIFGGMLGGIVDLLKTVEELEKQGEKETVKRGEMAGPSGSKVLYEYRVRIGPGIRPGIKGIGLEKALEQQKVIKPEKFEQEYLVDVFETEGDINIVAQLPNVKEQDLSYKISRNLLEINVKTERGEIKKNIKIPETADVSKIKKISFKNGILEIKLKKKRR